MVRKKKKMPTLGAGSLADVAFLLLIFFLVTTTIQTDAGIMSLLPPYQENPTSRPIHERNLLAVQLNANNELLIRGKPMQVQELRDYTKAFILNKEKMPNRPSSPNKAVISLINDNGTAYDAYIQVYNELKAAYGELWETEAQKQYGSSYELLTTNERKQVRQQYPLVISEAEPTNFAELEF